MGRSDCCTATPTVSPSWIGTFCMSAVPLVCGDSISRVKNFFRKVLVTKKIHTPTTYHPRFVRPTTCKRHYSFSLPRQTWFRRTIFRGLTKCATPNKLHLVLYYIHIVLTHCPIFYSVHPLIQWWVPTLLWKWQDSCPPALRATI
jgi:hypothetical protein